MNLADCRLDRIMYPKAMDLKGMEEGSPVFIIGEFISPQATTPFTAKGQLITPKIGLTYTLLDGKWTPNTYRGKTTQQFNFDFGKSQVPTDTKGIYRYLCNYASFVGSTIAQRLVDRYGEMTLEEIKNSPNRVAHEIKGLSKDRANTIKEELEKNEHIEAEMIELEGLLGDVAGIPKNLIPRIVQEYGASSMERIKENPYILTQFRGVGFILADRVGMERIGVKPDSMFRLAACAEYCLKMEINSGSIWIIKTTVVANGLKLIQKDITPGVDRLIEKGRIIEKNRHVTFTEHHENESLIASRLTAMATGAPEQPPAVMCLECFGAGCDRCERGKIEYVERLEI